MEWFLSQFPLLVVALVGICDGMNGFRPRRVIHGTPGLSHGMEPVLWPDLVVRKVPVDGDGLFVRPARRVKARPERLPAPLRLTCSLLI